MHADTLYHKMLDQEAQVEKAKAEGLPIPTFPPLMSNPVIDKDHPSTLSMPKYQAMPESQATGTTDNRRISENERDLKAGLNAESAKNLDTRLDKLSPEERELEVEAIRAEYRAGEHVAGRLNSIYQKQEDEKKARKEAGKETLGDYLGSLFK